MLHRLRGGKGQHIDIALIEVLFSYHELAVQMYDTTGGQWVAKRSGARHDMLSPVGIYPCKGATFFLLGIKSSVARFQDRDEAEDLLNDPRFSDLKPWASTKTNSTPLSKSGWIRCCRASTKPWPCCRSTAPCAPILSIPEVMALPHNKERGLMRTIPDGTPPAIHVPRTPLRVLEFLIILISAPAIPGAVQPRDPGASGWAIKARRKSPIWKPAMSSRRRTSESAE
ncbi:MAG: CoA transferase [Gammaproteobacteria bacterium]|nr:CoA transferase [Gammaproteobacteria bacterium]